MEPEDLDLLYRIENDPELWGIGVTNVPYSRYVLRDYIARSSGDAYTDGQVRLIVENRKNEVVGIVDLVNFDARNRKAEISIVIESRYRHKGFATDAINLVADYGRRVLHLHQIYAIIDTLNSSSLQLFRQLNFQESNHLPEWLYDGEEYHDAILMHKEL